MPESITYNIDCLEYMKKLPDNFFDLAVADPPFGDAQQDIGTYNRFGSPGSRFEKYKPAPDVLLSADGEPMSTHTHTHRAEESVTRTGGTWAEKYGKKIVAWDVAPEKEFFDELFRVSRDQVIFGANYFALPPTRCFLVWRKLTISESFTMAMAEYAWTSFNQNAKVFECAPQGKKDDARFHPCLPAGTKVFFNGEWKPIETVNVGDANKFGTVSCITTHDAERMVAITSDGKTVEATWNHPFLVKRENSVYWINADHIQEGDELLRLKETTHLRKKDICDTEQTENGVEWSIASFGKNTMAKFQKVCKSITSTATKPITILPICSLSRPLNTSGCTKVADLKTAFGINLANVAESTKPLTRKTGISIKRQGGLLHRIAGRVMLKKLSRNVVCESLTVGSVRIINEKTLVYNLTIDGIPAFETEIGITHNTQKPIELYSWIYGLFAKPGMTIFDPMFGSGASRIAAWNAGLDYVGCEIDPIYYQKEEERFEKYAAQQSLF